MEPEMSVEKEAEYDTVCQNGLRILHEIMRHYRMMQGWDEDDRDYAMYVLRSSIDQFLEDEKTR